MTGEISHPLPRPRRSPRPPPPPAPFLPRIPPLEEPPLIRPRRHRHIKKPHHHFIVGLFTPPHRCARIRVMSIPRRIVEPRHRLQFRSRLQHPRLGQPVAHLPVKVIVHAQQRLHIRAARTSLFSVHHVIFK